MEKSYDDEVEKHMMIIMIMMIMKWKNHMMMMKWKTYGDYDDDDDDEVEKHMMIIMIMMIC